MKVVAPTAQEFSQLLNLSIEKSDLTMVKLILSKFNWDQSSTSTDQHELIQIYGYSIRVMDFELFLIRLSSLFKSSLIDIVQVSFTQSKKFYPKPPRSEIVTVIDPDVAQLILSTKFSSDFKFKFSHRCIKDDLSNAHLFSNNYDISWIDTDVDILNYKKLQFMVNNCGDIELSDKLHTQSFNGDIELYKSFQSIFGIHSISQNTTLCALINKHYQLVEYILQQPKSYNLLRERLVCSITYDDELIFKKLLPDQANCCGEISSIKPKYIDGRIAYLKKVSRIDMDEFYSKQFKSLRHYSFYGPYEKPKILSILESVISKCNKGGSNIGNFGKSKEEIINLIQLVTLVGNLKLMGQLSRGFYFNRYFKLKLIEMLVRKSSNNQMLLYLISIGILVPERRDECDLLSTHLVFFAIVHNNQSAITSLLNLISKGKPFIKSNYLIDYCNLANEIHLQIFKNCDISMNENLITINSNSLLNYLISINYSFKPTKILLKPIENFDPSTFKLREHSKFLKNVGLFDFIFNNDNSSCNITDSICSNVENLEFT